LNAHPANTVQITQLASVIALRDTTAQANWMPLQQGQLTSAQLVSTAQEAQLFLSSASQAPTKTLLVRAHASLAQLDLTAQILACPRTLPVQLPLQTGTAQQVHCNLRSVQLDSGHLLTLRHAQIVQMAHIAGHAPRVNTASLQMLLEMVTMVLLASVMSPRDSCAV
jgi:hypothetical protein